MDRREHILRYVQLVHTHTPRSHWIAASVGSSPKASKQAWLPRIRNCRELELLVDDLHKLEDKWQIYLRLTPMGVRPVEGRGLERDSSGASVLWVDIDAYGKIDAALSQLRQHPHPPTMVVSSGYGLSVYWLLDKFETDLEAIKARNKKLAIQFKAVNGDSCFDLARVMRIPGTFNLKRDEPVLAEILEYHPDRIYKLDDFEPAVLDDDDNLPASASPEGIPDNFEDAIRSKKVKLWRRITSAEGAPTAGDGTPDYSRNDWSIACALLNLGFSQGVVMSVLMHPEWASGAKFRRTRSALYVIRTVAAAARHVMGSVPRDVEGARPSIYVPPGTYDVEDIVVKTFEAFTSVATTQGKPLLYVTPARELCELVHDPVTKQATTRLFNRHSLRRVVQQQVQWYTTTGKQDRRPTTVPDKVLDTMLAAPNEDVPVLDRVVTVPTFFLDRKGDPVLVDKPGYHAQYRIYYEPSLDIGQISIDPSDEELDAARRLILDDLLYDFPFADDASRAHAVALTLLPFVRELIRGPTPFHLVDAPVQGSGKGLCVQAALSVYFGSQLNHTSESENDEEWRKRLLSLARGGIEYLWIDNITKGMNWSSIAAALTGCSITERVLGQSQTTTVPVRFIWVGTANNAVVNDDLLRRLAYIRLNWTDRDVDQPKDLAQQFFKHNPLLHWASANRKQLVRAALVMCQAGLSRGRSAANKNSFEDWSHIIGTILNGCGIPGFLANDGDLREMTQDDSTDKAVDILGAAVELIGWGSTFTAKQLAEKLSGPDGILYMPDGIKSPAKFIGIMLSGLRDRVVAGKYVVRRSGDKRDGFQWSIHPYKGGQSVRTDARAAD